VQSGTQRRALKEGSLMDVAFIGALLVLFGLTLGLVRLCESV
jgi:hypothetical protein